MNAPEHHVGCGHLVTAPVWPPPKPRPPELDDAAIASGSRDTWSVLRSQADRAKGSGPVAMDLLSHSVLRHGTLEEGLSNRLAESLGTPRVTASRLEAVLMDGLSAADGPTQAVSEDLRAAVDRDRAHPQQLHVFLFYKGFLALQAHRCAHWLWRQHRHVEALFLQARTSEVFGVDIHPGAAIEAGIVIDHASGVVVGETAVIEAGVYMFHEATLGATGKHGGDRHPKVRRDALIGAGARVLGNVEIGRGARVGAGSVVLDDVPAFATVVGVPARVVALRDPAAPQAVGSTVRPPLPSGPPLGVRVPHRPLIPAPTISEPPPASAAPSCCAARRGASPVLPDRRG